MSVINCDHKVTPSTSRIKTRISDEHDKTKHAKRSDSRIIKSKSGDTPSYEASIHEISRISTKSLMLPKNSLKRNKSVHFEKTLQNTCQSRKVILHSHKECLFNYDDLVVKCKTVSNFNKTLIQIKQLVEQIKQNVRMEIEKKMSNEYKILNQLQLVLIQTMINFSAKIDNFQLPMQDIFWQKINNFLNDMSDTFQNEIEDDNILKLKELQSELQKNNRKIMHSDKYDVDTINKKSILKNTNFKTQVQNSTVDFNKNMEIFHKLLKQIKALKQRQALKNQLKSMENVSDTQIVVTKNNRNIKVSSNLKLNKDFDRKMNLKPFQIKIDENCVLKKSNLKINSIESSTVKKSQKTNHNSEILISRSESTYWKTDASERSFENKCFSMSDNFEQSSVKQHNLKLQNLQHANRSNKISQLNFPGKTKILSVKAPHINFVNSNGQAKLNLAKTQSCKNDITQCTCTIFNAKQSLLKNNNCQEVLKQPEKLIYKRESNICSEHVKNSQDLYPTSKSFSNTLNEISEISANENDDSNNESVIPLFIPTDNINNISKALLHHKKKRKDSMCIWLDNLCHTFIKFCSANDSTAYKKSFADNLAERKQSMDSVRFGNFVQLLKYHSKFCCHSLNCDKCRVILKGISHCRTIHSETDVQLILKIGELQHDTAGSQLAPKLDLQVNKPKPKKTSKKPAVKKSVDTLQKSSLLVLGILNILKLPLIIAKIPFFIIYYIKYLFVSMFEFKTYKYINNCNI